MRTTRTTLIGLVVLALVAGACTARTPANDPAGGPSTPAGAPPSATSPASPDAWLAVGHKGAAALEIILASTREKLFDLPSGAPNARWGRLITAEVQGDKTVVRDLVVQPGFGGETTTIAGAWRLPTIGPEPVPVGVSEDGKTIVLVSAKGGPTSRFAVLQRGFPKPAQVIELPGRFEYDALSPDGSTLYVVQHLDAEEGGKYQVRAVNAATGQLAEGIIVDKRNIEEQMAGYPLAQVRREDGLVLTLYQGVEFAFIHALNTIEGWAVCIDLPASGLDDARAAADWGLAQAPDGRSVYAVNATLGLVADIDPAQQGLRRSVSVKPLAGSGIVLAKFGHQEGGPTGRRVVVGPDGKTIYAAGAGGILALDATTLKVTATFEKGRAIDALAVTPDGGTLFALLLDGHIVKIDAATGTRLGTVPGDGYDRLVAVVPW
ncbi:MAG: hypothetical protein M3P84_05345 [Chloroflexota bacterium]|nr:hypothetical protein [Chloroflexota bacterium]